MVLYGIMGYRVDRAVLEAEIKRITDLGIETRMGVRVGVDVTLDQLEKEFDAVFVGIGAQVGRSMPVPGFEGTKEVTNAIDFLRNYEVLGDDIPVGKKVIVIGDGNVAHGCGPSRPPPWLPGSSGVSRATRRDGMF